MSKFLYFILVFTIALLTSTTMTVADQGYTFGRLFTVSETNKADVRKEIIFVGDIMLARKVEHYMTVHSAQYPFTRLDPFRSDAFVVGNFESSIPVVHRRTPYYTFGFSTRPDFANILTQNGFTHVSIANNHSYDSGHDGFMHTEQVLEQSGLDAIGHPSEVSSSSVSYLELENGSVAIVAIHTLSKNPYNDSLIHLLKEAETQSDIQIIYVHWGNEYALYHARAQEVLARKLISHGVDAIIGHHPHVVQDIQLTDGVPVFYSLGNFVFDQYFSKDVQEGLKLHFSFSKEELMFRLEPVTSVDMQSAPRPMYEAEKALFLNALSKRSSSDLQPMITQGLITIRQ